MSAGRETSKPAGDLRAGDRTPWYSVVTVVREGRTVAVLARWPDGSLSERVWDNPEHLVLVLDPEQETP